MGDDPASDFEALRPLLFAIAYRMLSSVTEAEDVVQEAWLRYHRAVSEGAEVGSAKAYLSAVTTRLAIDQLRSARVRRERYVGEWLPEPLLTDSAPDPADQVADAETLSMAFLLVLDSLSPVERAVFLLHDVFAFDFAEVARVVGRSEGNCRQIAVRARRHVAANRPRFETSPGRRDELADKFVRAFAAGDVDELLALLAPDAVVVGDSGGVPPAWQRPIVGQSNVARLLAGLSGQLSAASVRVERAEVNGQPGAVVRTVDGAIVNVFAFDVAAGAVQTIRSVISRDKLRHLGEVADLQALRATRRDRPTGPLS